MFTALYIITGFMGRENANANLSKNGSVPEDGHSLEPHFKCRASKPCQRYPVMHGRCDTRSIERHMQAMKDELSKARYHSHDTVDTGF